MAGDISRLAVMTTDGWKAISDDAPLPIRLIGGSPAPDADAVFELQGLIVDLSARVDVLESRAAKSTTARVKVAATPAA